MEQKIIKKILKREQEINTETYLKKKKKKKKKGNMEKTDFAICLKKKNSRVSKKLSRG